MRTSERTNDRSERGLRIVASLLMVRGEASHLLVASLFIFLRLTNSFLRLFPSLIGSAQTYMNDGKTALATKGYFESDPSSCLPLTEYVEQNTEEKRRETAVIPYATADD